MIHIHHKQILNHLVNKMQDEFLKCFDADMIEINIDSYHELGITDEKLGLLYFDIMLSGTYIFNNDDEVKFKLDITNDELIDNLTNEIYECI